jgi:excinuclease ABC subunit C
MKRRIAESLLDECPGVSEARKQALLREFGSVARMRRATVEQIASVPGIGLKLAETIVTFLREHRSV